MSDLCNDIFKIKISKSYIEYFNYCRNNIFRIAKTSRRK